MRSLIISLVFVTFSSAATAQVTVPHTFIAGTAASAAEVNANFQALVTAINDLGTRVSKLEGQITSSDLVGTYSVNRFQSEFNETPDKINNNVSIYTSEGTVTLAANGTGTVTGITEFGRNLNFALATGPGMEPLTLTHSNIVRPQPTEGITWSFSGGRVNVFGGTFSIVAGGRLLIRSSANPVDGTNVLVMLTRVN